MIARRLWIMQQQSVWVCEDGMLWDLCFSLDEINCRERSPETSLGCRGKVASGKQAPAGFKGRHWCYGRRSYLTARWLATGDRIDSMCLRSCSEGALPARSTASFSFLFALGESRSSDLLPSLISVVDRRVAPVERAGLTHHEWQRCRVMPSLARTFNPTHLK